FRWHADHWSTERCHTHDAQQVHAHHPAPHLRVHTELERGVERGHVGHEGHTHGHERGHEGHVAGHESGQPLEHTEGSRSEEYQAHVRSFPSCGQQGTDERTDGEGGGGPAEGLCPGLEHVVDHERDLVLGVGPEELGACGHDQQYDQVSSGTDVAHPFADTALATGDPFGPVEFGGTDHQQ